VAHTGEERTRFWWESQNERDHWEDQGIDGRMGSELILKRLAGDGVDSVGSGYGPMEDCCERGDESSGSGTMELVVRTHNRGSARPSLRPPWKNSY
jgi:hypothetical protein